MDTDHRASILTSTERLNQRKNNSSRQSLESCFLVSEPHCDVVVEECVELVSVAGPVAREGTRPLDGPLGRGISPTLSMDAPPAGALQHDQ